MNAVKSFLPFLVKVLVAMIVINGVLSLLGGGIVAQFVTNPIGTVKGFFDAKTSTATGA